MSDEERVGSCIFCQILTDEIPTERIAETETYIVVKDINPKAPVHLLFIAKTHISSLNDFSQKHREMIADIFEGIRDQANTQGVAESGYRVIINNGVDARQEVHHLHVHLLGGVKMEAMV